MISLFSQGFEIEDFPELSWPGLSLPIKSVNTIEISGIGDDIGYASVSEPVHVQCNGNYYLDQAIQQSGDPNDVDIDFTGFPMEENCQMIIATPDGSPFAPDLIGMPFMQDKWTVIYPQERVYAGGMNQMLPFDQNTPDVRFYERGSTEAPDCAEWIELWFPEGPRHNLDNPGEDPSVASSPEIDGVRLSWNGTETTARMIVDTGAPLTFISSEVALAMGLDHETETPFDIKTVAGVLGTPVDCPGFIFDYLILTTIDGDELLYYLVAYVLDIHDSEGNIYTDGLSGNNLFHYETDLVGFETVFFDMEDGYLGLNHSMFTDDPYLPEPLALLQQQYGEPIPLPSTLSLFLLGLGGLCLCRRRSA